ncbi:MAG: hypothetical protein JWQ27_1400 [Ferruginibacter sp.]|nr:hypothetical protein [Ferruginibacter sp.]
MNINHDNYEMFFLLYVDNELSAAERAEVAAYVAANPELYEEFMQLQELVLPADEPIVFSGKETLYKSVAMNEALQDDLLMHLDGELAADKSKELAEKINSSKSLQTEWAILQQTKLDAAEIISFPDKQSLYRKERKGVVIVRMMRWAVAALLIGGGIFIGLKFMDQQHSTDQSAVAVNGKNNNIVNIKSPATITSTEIAETGQSAVHAKSNPQTTGTNNSEPTNLTLAKKDQVKVNAASPVTTENQPDENRLLANNVVLPGKKVSPERAVGELVVTNPTTRPEQAQSLTDVNLKPMDNITARTAGLADITQEEDPDRILYMSEENLTRTKAGGFLRKIKRMVERNAKVITGNGIRIAGFELAAK